MAPLRLRQRLWLTGRRRLLRLQLLIPTWLMLNLMQRLMLLMRLRVSMMSHRRQKHCYYY